MSFYKEFTAAIKSYSEAHRLIKKHKLWWYIIIPGIINAILFIVLFFKGWQYSNEFTDRFFKYIGLDGTHEGWLKYLVLTFYFLTKYIIRFSFILLYFFTYRYIVLALLTPLMAILSEKTEFLINGKKYPFSFKQLLKDSLRSLLLAVRNFIVEFFFTVIFIFVGLIPFVGLISPIALLLISCYFYGFSMIDFTNERHRMKFSHSIRFVQQHKGTAIGVGFIFYLILMIPVFGILFAPAYGVIAATISTLQVKNTQT